MTIESKLENSENSEVSEQSQVLSETKGENCIIKDNLQILLESFSRVAAISDPVHQEYEITKEARNLDVPLEGYRRMFDTYRKPSKRKKVPSKLDTVIKPVSLADKKVGDFITWFQSISVFKLTAVFSQITLLIAMLSFVLDAPRRQQQAIDAARTVFESASNQVYSQARKSSLNTLNRYCVSMTGVNAVKADLEGIQLNHCYVQNKFSSEMFAHWPPKFFRYQGFDLSYANLENSNLSGANLEDANLQGANLQGANLNGANLKGANLQDADLNGANLKGANLLGANLQNSNLKNGDLSRANLQGVNFQGANMVDAKLYWSNIREANFLSSNLQGANLSRSYLQGSDFYKANLKGASLRHADLREGTNLREAELEGTNLANAKFWSLSQLKRGKNWEKSVKNLGWEYQITHPSTENFRIGLIKSTTGSLFDSYRQGMEKAAAGQKVEIISLQSKSGVDNETQAINQLISAGADGILLLPEDPQNSAKTIKEAYESGVAVFTVGDCINEGDANRYLFGCYHSDRYQMGYDSGSYLAKWATKNLSGKDVNVAILDATSYDTFYPSLQGFYAAMKDANISWHEVISINAALRSNLPEVKEVLTSHPQINIIWGGSNASTDVAVKAAEELGLKGKVFVFGMSNFDREHADKLLSSDNPLELIIDQAGQDVGYNAVKSALSILDGNITPYQFHLVKHRVFTQDDKEIMQKLLNEIDAAKH